MVGTLNHVTCCCPLPCCHCQPGRILFPVPHWIVNLQFNGAAFPFFTACVAEPTWNIANEQMARDHCLSPVRETTFLTLFDDGDPCPSDLGPSICCLEDPLKTYSCWNGFWETAGYLETFGTPPDCERFHVPEIELCNYTQGGIYSYVGYQMRLQCWQYTQPELAKGFRLTFEAGDVFWPPTNFFRCSQTVDFIIEESRGDPNWNFDCLGSNQWAPQDMQTLTPRCTTPPCANACITHDLLGQPFPFDADILWTLKVQNTTTTNPCNVPTQ